MTMEEIGRKARKAARSLALLDTDAKNRALELIAENLVKNGERVIFENAKDIRQGKENNLGEAMLDRLRLDDARIRDMADGVKHIVSLADPVGRVYGETVRPNGLQVHRVRIPIGVIGIIYESRPNVTADAAALCLKSGNGVILRGGKEAFHSNRAIASVIAEALEQADVNRNAVQFIETTDRALVLEMLKMSRYIDVIIPRGGNALIKFVSENSTIPVIKHDAGVCSVYIDEGADFQKARAIAVNSKVQRPGVCNAAETLLVHANWIDNLASLLEKMVEQGVEIRACEKSRAVFPQASAATEDDWYAEYLSLVISVKVVDSMEEAINHIETYGSHHTEAIVTPSEERAGRFVKAVDSSAVIVNASTRFNDGGQFGLGAEMGISTQKLHCRGPMGLEELTTYKYVAVGDGQVRD